MNDQQREARLAELRKIASEYAEAKSNRIYLMEFRKSQKAILMKKYEVEGIKTAAGQEREAYADDGYLELLEGLREAVEAEEKLKFELLISERRFEEYKAKMYAKSAEMKYLG